MFHFYGYLWYICGISQCFTTQTCFENLWKKLFLAMEQSGMISVAIMNDLMLNAVNPMPPINNYHLDMVGITPIYDDFGDGLRHWVCHMTPLTNMFQGGWNDPRLLERGHHQFWREPSIAWPGGRGDTERQAPGESCPRMVMQREYPLVNIQKAIENGHL